MPAGLQVKLNRFLRYPASTPHFPSASGGPERPELCQNGTLRPPPDPHLIPTVRSGFYGYPSS